VVNANSHYHAFCLQLLINDIQFVAQQTTRTNASVYLMEPSPKEWPTANSFFINKCEFKCHCEAMTAEHLLGHVPYPKIIQSLLFLDDAPVGNGTTIQEAMTMTTKNSMGHIPLFWNHLLQFLQECYQGEDVLLFYGEMQDAR